MTGKIIQSGSGSLGRGIHSEMENGLSSRRQRVADWSGVDGSLSSL
jgi:hypothetical protein